MSGISLLSNPFALLLQRASIALTQIHQPLCFRNLCFHLHDQHFQLLLALLAGVGVDIAGVLFAVGPFGRIAPFKEVVVDLTDAAGAGSALAAHIGLEIGHTRLFRLGRGRVSRPGSEAPVERRRKPLITLRKLELRAFHRVQTPERSVPLSPVTNP